MNLQTVHFKTSDFGNISKPTHVSNVYCSHSTQFYSKQKYNSEGKQIGEPTDEKNFYFLTCIHCNSEFQYIQRCEYFAIKQLEVLN